MKAAIYIRTWHQDKGHHAYTMDRQEQHARELAQRNGLNVAFEHVFSDLDYPGDLPPACWNFDDSRDSRPALSALIEAVENGDIQRVIVRKMERLGTAADTLSGLLECFRQNGVLIVATPENISSTEDPSEAFAISILRPCIRYDTEEERERKQRLKNRKIEEIERLKGKIARLESEVAELNL